MMAQIATRAHAERLPRDAPGPAADAGAPQGRARFVGLGLLGLALAAFFVMQAFALLPHPADEGIYFYGAWRLSQGTWPYRDFFHAHPPFHLLPTTLVFWLFGPSELLARLPTCLGAAASGMAAFGITWRTLPDVRACVRAGAAVWATTSLLFSESFLKASATDTGICQATGWLALGAWLLTCGRPMAAGLAVACAPLTLLQAAPAAATLVLAAGLRGRQSLLRTATAAGGLYTAVHLLAWGLVGSAFWQQVYGFHLDKVGTPGEGARQLGFVLFDNWTLFALAVAGAAAELARSGGSRALAALAGLSAGVTFAAMATRPRVFPFYFQPAFLPLALLAGWGSARVAESLLSWWPLRRRPGARWPLRQALGPLLAALALLGPLREPLRTWVSPRRSEQLATYAQTYGWQDAPGLGPLNALVRAAFWQSGVRVPGREAHALTQYLWQRSRWLDVQPQLVSAVKAEAARNPRTLLLGDSTVAPAVAFAAGVRIPGDVVDTNVQRFRAGNLRLDEVFALLEAEPHTLLLIGDSGGLGSLPALRAYAQQHYQPLQVFSTRTASRYTLWRRRPRGEPGYKRSRETWPRAAENDINAASR